MTPRRKCATVAATTTGNGTRAPLAAVLADLPATGAQVEVGLLQKQYLPFVKKDGEELPPLFSTEHLTSAVAQELEAISEIKNTQWVEFHVRRFDGLVRRMALPHPVTYSRLVPHLADNWGGLSSKLTSPNSFIKPSRRDDGRIIRMDYEESSDALSRDSRLAHGKQFMVKADISNCFPSIYTHSLDWALRGKAIAKADRFNKTWESKVDKLTQGIHDGETKGLMIGPAVSNVLSELVLQRLDEALRADSFEFVRFVDDLTAYCTTREHAESFIVKLQRLLSEYRLDLNRKKTAILDLRSGISEPWLAEASAYLPPVWGNLAAGRYLRHAEALAFRYPQKSVLKYAVKSLLANAPTKLKGTDSSVLLVAEELVRLTAFHPHLLPFLCRELSGVSGYIGHERHRLGSTLARQLADAATRGETDAVLWLLYIVRHQLGYRLSKEIWQPIIEMDDDLALTALAQLWGPARQAVLNRVVRLPLICEGDREVHWLIRYELHRLGLLKEADLSTNEKLWMKVLKKHSVKFWALKK